MTKEMGEEAKKILWEQFIECVKKDKWDHLKELAANYRKESLVN